MNQEIEKAIKAIKAEQEKIVSEIENLKKEDLETLIEDLDKIIDSQIELLQTMEAQNDLQKNTSFEKEDL